MPAANLSFLPWIRQGAAGAIATVDTLGSSQPAAVDVSVVLNVNTSALPAVPLRLRGPADVVGIDRHQIVRTDPRPNTSDFEPNCFPSIEFDRADFPWLFTPAGPTPAASFDPGCASWSCASRTACSSRAFRMRRCRNSGSRRQPSRSSSFPI